MHLYDTNKKLLGIKFADDIFFREKFIPMTRSSMVRELVEEKYFLNDEEQRLLPKFASLLDNVIMNQYRVDLTDLKVKW